MPRWRRIETEHEMHKEMKISCSREERHLPTKLNHNCNNNTVLPQV
jgi:hypothetical protein